MTMIKAHWNWHHYAIHFSSLTNPSISPPYRYCYQGAQLHKTSHSPHEQHFLNAQSEFKTQTQRPYRPNCYPRAKVVHGCQQPSNWHDFL